MEYLSHEQLRELLSRLSWQREVTYCANLGNAGDAVISTSTWYLFDQCGIMPRSVDFENCETTQPGGLFVYGGGGNLVPNYDHARRALLQAFQQPYEYILLLPHTIRGHEDLLKKLDHRTHIICRDRISYQHVKAFSPNAHIYLADDMAFSLNPAWALSRLRFMRNRLRLTEPTKQRYKIWRAKIQGITRNTRQLTVLRGDVESAQRGEPRGVNDISALYCSTFASRAESDLVTYDFLRFLDHSSNIVTDRLHVAICGSLLQKRVVLLDNSYGKNRAVYELSLLNRFPGTEFSGALQPTT